MLFVCVSISLGVLYAPVELGAGYPRLGTSLPLIFWTHAEHGFGDGGLQLFARAMQR